MPNILHITPDDIISDSFKLGKKIYESGFFPQHAISLWRGGTPIGLGVHAFFRMKGIWFNHTTVATASYTGINERSEVIVKNLEHVIKCICPEDNLLIIDDIYETGNTIERIISTLKEKARANCPKNILVATIHSKPEKHQNKHDLLNVKEIRSDIWIDYPHELSDLVSDNGDDSLIKEKDEKLYNILHTDNFETEMIYKKEKFIYTSYKELLYDSFKLGVNIYNQKDFFPDYIIALWPGGIWSGLPIHEVFKYFLKINNDQRKTPDHIAISTADSHLSYRSNIIGCQYLEDHVNKNDNILIIDTTFKSGRLISNTVEKLKESLRRNLNHKRIKVASIYYNPNDDSTWINKPIFKKPDYYLKQINCDVIYPTSIYKIPDVLKNLRSHNPDIVDIVF